MAIRTPQEYIESLKDGRVVFFEERSQRKILDRHGETGVKSKW